MTRQQMLNLLRSLQAGRSTLAALRDKELGCTLGYSSPKFYINGGEVSQSRYFEEVDKQSQSGRQTKLKFTYGPEEPV